MNKRHPLKVRRRRTRRWARWDRWANGNPARLDQGYAVRYLTRLKVERAIGALLLDQRALSVRAVWVPTSVGFSSSVAGL